MTEMGLLVNLKINEMVALVLSLILVVTCTVNAGVLRDEATTCGYQSCPPLKEGAINVHLVPHTHDDVGWLKTVDQYFYGSNSSIQRAGVQYILDSVIQELKKDSTRRFIYVETSFFWKWWIHQHDIVKQQVRKFVNNGQLEFIGGAWTMNDEATTNYHSIIDQFTWGLRKLNESFGECGRPRIGWQIDPFGHSREMASIFAQLGFDGLLLGRIDFQDKGHRFSDRTAEIVWKGSDNLGPKGEIFTGVLYNTYGPPSGFCWDIMCNDEPLVDDKKSPLYNIDRKVDDFFKYLDNMTEVYTTKNLLVTMGEDFHYQDANTWYKNLDKLIYYANQRQGTGSKYNLFYSTPSCYVKAVHDEAASKKWPTKEDDFFPYASDQHSFWTGYFSSRPTLKRFEREGNNFLQVSDDHYPILGVPDLGLRALHHANLEKVCKQLYALTELGPEDWVDLNALREAMGVMQHHDAVTGTEKQHVANDYARILQNGIDECQIITNTALSKIITKTNSTPGGEDPVPEIPITSCLLANISSCPLTETSESFIVTVYNPLSRPTSKYVRLPVSFRNATVEDPEGPITVQLLPTADGILNVPGRTSKTDVELVFLARDIPPLGFKSYYVASAPGDMVTIPDEGLTALKAYDIRFTINSETGLLDDVTLNGITVKVKQEFLYYDSSVGNNSNPDLRSSGAYIFRPSNTATTLTGKATKVYRGELVSEVHQTFNEWASQIIRIYSEENFVEFDWLIGPIPNGGTIGKEVITRFSTNLATKGIFYTDSNGRELLKRIRNFRPTWELELQESISGNYYPVTSKIVLVDEENDIEFAVLNDRAQGGSSLNDGEVELMVHRNCLHDDAFGVGEALNETAFGKPLVARGSHYLILGPLKGTGEGPSTAAQERDLAQRKLLSTWTFVSPTTNKTAAEYRAAYIMQYAGLKTALPDNVQILTLEPWKGFSLLMRLEHVLEAGEDPNLSKPATVDITELFAPFKVTSIRETTLAANQWLEDSAPLHFEAADTPKESLSMESRTETVWKRVNKRAIIINATDYKDNFQITLTPMQIRTFVVDTTTN